MCEKVARVCPTYSKYLNCCFLSPVMKYLVEELKRRKIQFELMV